MQKQKWFWLVDGLCIYGLDARRGDGWMLTWVVARQRFWGLSYIWDWKGDPLTCRAWGFGLASIWMYSDKLGDGKIYKGICVIFFSCKMDYDVDLIERNDV